MILTRCGRYKSKEIVEVRNILKRNESSQKRRDYYIFYFR
jgi:hypothetical protein